MKPEDRRSDAEVQQDVLRELKWDTRVEETDVGVEVDRGVVTLTGTVSGWGKMLAAQEAAHRVRGVLDVANDIRVRDPRDKPTDTDIALAVRHALEWNDFLPEQRIHTTVSDGVVTLRGDVDSMSQRDEADHAVRNLTGVRALFNDIVVRPPMTVKPENIRHAIEEALERQAAREARRIDLEVHEGRVTVTGKVHSWSERQAVIGAVKGTLGVRAVEDHLLLQPYTG